MAIEVLQARRICPKGSLIESVRMECEFETYEDFASFASQAREIERAGGGDLDFSYRDTTHKHNTQTQTQHTNRTMKIINVSQQVLEAAEKIRRECPQAVFGGSFSLALRGIDLKRPVKDLDVLIPAFTGSMFSGLCDGHSDLGIYSDSCDFYGYVTVNGVKVDVGQWDSQFNPDEREGFRLNSVLAIYAAKMKYISVTDAKNPAYGKHLGDCQIIANRLDFILGLRSASQFHWLFRGEYGEVLAELEYAIELYREGGNYGNPEL